MVTEAGNTRTRLIEDAERLFAERGVNAVSLREIASVAGQRNTSAVAYHFGTKESLVAAIYQHRLGPTNDLQMRRLAELDDQGLGQALPALVEVFVRPMIERLERPSWFLRFVANALYVERVAPYDLAAEAWTRALHQLLTRINACINELPTPVQAHRLEFFIGLFVHTLAHHERQIQLGRGVRTKADRELLAADLVDAAVALLTAPVSSATHDKL
ncbi:TetR/AcrR family transcriptional regulator [Streptomyces sp. NPDC048419]|uniref:TetR/AcrR family transcriptional regulator n=1 Tax=Streptomyces sp. NPDC048419 TaxID=3365547 RepID=UPI0037150CFA